MSISSQDINFTELASSVRGEGLEGLTRLLGLRLGLEPDWTGRGPDGGRDLIFTQTISSPLKVSIRWLVSCKDYASSGKSVPETDLPPSFDGKLIQHQAQGFLLVTTTIPGTNTKSILDQIALNRKYFTDVWDEHRLREMLIQPKNEDLLKLYLPRSYERIIAREGSGQDTTARIAEIFQHAFPPHYERLLIPGIPDPLPRMETRHVEDLLDKGKAVIVAGEAGTGKSGIAWALSYPRSNPDMPVLLVDARRCAAEKIGEEIGLQDHLARSIERLGKRIGCRVLIDQLDSVAAEPSGQGFVRLALHCAKLEGVQVAVIARRRESYEHRLLDDLTASDFTEITCGDLSDEEVRTTLDRIGLNSPSDELISLGKNILNLSLIASIRQADPGFIFDSVLDEVVLWERYMSAIQDSASKSPHGPTFGEDVLRESLILAKRGLELADRVIRLDFSPTSAQRCLISWRILVPEREGAFRFYHEELQDYLYARNAVSRELMADQVLAEISHHSTKNVFVWMERLYKHHKSPLRMQFLESAFGNV